MSITIFKTRPIDEMTDHELKQALKPKWWTPIAAFFGGDKWRQRHFDPLLNEQLRRQIVRERGEGDRSPGLTAARARKHAEEETQRLEKERAEGRGGQAAFEAQLQWYRDHPMRCQVEEDQKRW